MENFRKFTQEDYDRAMKLLDEIHAKPEKYPEFHLPQWQPPPPDPNACKHPGMPILEFDAELARTLPSREVRRLFPRGNYHCPECKCSVIQYASFEHYIAGDW